MEKRPEGSPAVSGSGYTVLNPRDPIMSPANVEPQVPRALHIFAVVLSFCIVLLITAGGLVKSLEAGLSVPDWPLSYGSLNPPRWWTIENVRAEHGHRMIAGTIALLTVGLAIWLTRRESRSWVKKLGWIAVVAVLAQALLGGLTVLFFLPPPISISHAALAQLFFGSIVTIALVTSRFWLAGSGPVGAGDPGGRVAPLATSVTVLVFVQILLGAVMRHNGAGLAVPDFPLVFGGLLPPKWDFGIVIHLAHRLGALLVATGAFWLLGRVLRTASSEPVLRVWAWLLAILVLVQGTLGALVVLTGKQVLPNTLHAGTGALVLGSSLVLTLGSRRLAWLRSVGQDHDSQAPARAAVEGAGA